MRRHVTDSSLPLQPIWQEFNKGNYKKTLELLDQSPEENDDDWHLIHARTLTALDRYQEAKQAFAQIQNKTRTVVRLAEARLSQSLGQHNEAIKRYQEALDRENNDNYRTNDKNQKRIKDILMSLARCYEEMGDYQSATKQYDAIHHGKNDVDILIAESCLLSKQEKYVEANDKLKSVVGWNNDKERIISIARNLRLMNQHDEAMRLYDNNHWEKNVDFVMARAHCLREVGYYEEAVKTLQSVANWQSNENLVLEFSCLYQDMHDYDKSLAILKKHEKVNSSRKIKLALARACHLAADYQASLAWSDAILKENPVDKEALLAKGYCLTDKGDYQQAVSVFNTIPNAKKDKNVFIGLINACLEKGDYITAKKMLETNHPWKNDKSVRMSYGICLRKLGKFGEAVEVYDNLMAAYPHDKTIKLSVANCYEEMGRYTLALSSYAEIVNAQKDKKVVQCWSRCYQEKGDYQSAFAILKKFPNWRNDQQLLLSVARLYRLQYRHANAFAIYLKNVPVNNNRQQYSVDDLKLTDKSTIINLACHHEERGEFDLAISAYKAIPAWEQDKVVLKTLAHCYETAGNYQEALAIYNLPAFVRERDFWLAKACVYYKMDKAEEAKLIFKELLTVYPYYVDARYCECLFAFRYEDPNTEKMVNKLIKDHPFLPHAYLLQAKWCLKFDMLDQALAQLQQALLQFPFYFVGFLELLNIYLLKSDVEAVERLQKFCLGWFDGYSRLNNKIEKLIHSESLAKYHQTDFEIDLENKTTVLLPNLVVSLFEHLKISNLYLTGGAVLKLLNGEPLASNQNFDFVSMDNEADRIKLLQKGFSSIPQVPGLYAKQHSPYSTDVFLIKSKEKNARHFRYKSMYTRDFTITSLFCDATGNVIDPSGLGINDAKQKILRMIGNPAIRLWEDPVRLLRAVKYIVKGYKPTDGLLDAIMSWQPDSTLPMGHLQAVICKHLTNDADRLQYVKLLIEYGLYTKLFGLQPMDTLEGSLLRLQIAVGLQVRSTSMCYSQRLFNLRSLTAEDVVAKTSFNIRVNVRLTSEEIDQRLAPSNKTIDALALESMRKMKG